MNPFFSGAAVGAAIGVLVTGYALSDKFRTWVNDHVKGAATGKEKRPKAAKEPEKERPVPKKKQHTCMKCGELGTIDDMDEANFADSKATGWIHTHCRKSLEERNDE